MHSIHLHDIHTPKGPNLYLLSSGALACFTLALLTYLIALLGGDGYAAQLGGNVTFFVLVLGVIATGICSVATRPEK